MGNSRQVQEVIDIIEREAHILSCIGILVQHEEFEFMKKLANEILDGIERIERYKQQELKDWAYKKFNANDSFSLKEVKEIGYALGFATKNTEGINAFCRFANLSTTDDGLTFNKGVRK